jgi:hypothetical protein
MWHQQADYNTYRAFFNNLSSELQSDVDLELRIPKIMELGDFGTITGKNITICEK